MTRMQLPIGGRGTAAEGEATGSDERSSGGGLGRKLLVGVAVGGAAYLVGRRLWSSDDEIEGGETTGDESAGAPDTGSAQEGAPDEPIEDVPGEDRSPEEIAERVGDDVDAKPAEPGEMAIDESVVEDAVDEAELATADEEDVAAEEDEDESS